jgi:hypothetical protein
LIAAFVDRVTAHGRILDSSSWYRLPPPIGPPA